MLDATLEISAGYQCLAKLNFLKEISERKVFQLVNLITCEYNGYSMVSGMIFRNQPHVMNLAVIVTEIDAVLCKNTCTKLLPPFICLFIFNGLRQWECAESSKHVPGKFSNLGHCAYPH